jgi:hypothetical protein
LATRRLECKTSRIDHGSQGGQYAERPKRETADLTQYPDLVVIYLGSEYHHWNQYNSRVWAGDSAGGGGEAGRTSVAWERFLFAAASWHEAVLAGFRIARKAVAVRAASIVVAEFS